MSKPTLQAVKRHFKNAQEVRCVKTGILIDIGLAADPYFHKGIYTIGNGVIALWFEDRFAEITKRKKSAKCQCENCNCEEKKKIVKRNPKK